MSQIAEVEITTLKEDSNSEAKCDNQQGNNEISLIRNSNDYIITTITAATSDSINNDTKNDTIDSPNKNSDTIIDNNSTNKRRTRSAKRRIPIYQTEDLIREISPKPASLEENNGNNDKKESNTNNINNNADNDTINITNDSKSVVVKEVEVKTFNGKRTVQCNFCNRRMTESKLANHIRLLHVDKPQEETIGDDNNDDSKSKKFRCEYCGKLYGTKYTHQQHVKTHTEGRPKCPECGTTFATAFSLFRHRAKNHNLEHNYQTYNCDECDKSFFSISELKLHKQRHSSKKEFKCDQCDKAFSVKGNLRIHMRTHAKEKLYRCDLCESTFSHPYSLVSHRRIHTNDFPFECPQCGKTYRSKHQLSSHLNVHSDNRPFKCKQCDKSFKSRTAFKMHQDEHQGIKRFNCKECGRAFQCHGNKLKHERRHIGEKNHKCQICDKAFIEKQELRNHSKVHERRSLAEKQSKPANSKEEQKMELEEDNKLVD